jgi:hypothetical protein
MGLAILSPWGVDDKEKLGLEGTAPQLIAAGLILFVVVNAIWFGFALYRRAWARVGLALAICAGFVLGTVAMVRSPVPSISSFRWWLDTLAALIAPVTAIAFAVSAAVALICRASSNSRVGKRD